MSKHSKQLGKETIKMTIERTITRAEVFGEEAHTDGYALEALVNQLASFKQSGADQIYFGALADNPEKEEDCTFGDLIEPAYHELTKLRRVMRARTGANQTNPFSFPAHAVHLTAQSNGSKTSRDLKHRSSGGGNK